MQRFLLGVIGWLMVTTQAMAHEVQPAVGDLRTEDGLLSLEITLNAEPIIAGVDLQGVVNTNETDLATEVDRLRAMTPDILQAEIEMALPQIAAALDVRADEIPVMLELESLEVDPVGNVELSRETTLRWQAALPPGTTSVSVDWPARYGVLILRQQGVEEPFTGFLTGGEGSGPISIAGGDELRGWAAFAAYIPVGFDHIVPKGLDHILFVLALFFLSTRLGPLLWQVSAFTAAHTVTLALGALGWVNIPASIVEPIIAASIAFVALENIWSKGLNRWRPAVVFGFGLLHGLGFASVLGEFGLPQDGFIAALIGFNVGVEVGQVFVIALAFALVWLAIRVDAGDIDTRTGQVVYAALALIFVALGFLLNTPGFADSMGAPAPVFLFPLAALSGLCVLSATKIDHLHAFRKFVAVPASAAIALVGVYWFIERVFF